MVSENSLNYFQGMDEKKRNTTTPTSREEKLPKKKMSLKSSMNRENSLSSSTKADSKDHAKDLGGKSSLGAKLKEEPRDLNVSMMKSSCVTRFFLTFYVWSNFLLFEKDLMSHLFLGHFLKLAAITTFKLLNLLRKKFCRPVVRNGARSIHYFS